jgi:hypothetical protein
MTTAFTVPPPPRARPKAHFRRRRGGPTAAESVKEPTVLSDTIRVLNFYVSDGCDLQVAGLGLLLPID